MKWIPMLGLIGLAALGQGPVAYAKTDTTKLFSCAFGAKRVLVDVTGGQIVYHFGTPGRDEISIIGSPKAGNIWQMQQRFAGMEYQIRFTKGEYSYIVYSAEGNANVGASAISGLVVMHGKKRIADKSCVPFAELDLPDEGLKVPQDVEDYSAM
ncbi:MAG: hypothetical protein KGQ46_03140 [Hyphomicrobiales bacterium]|nr:hypothetical protein [Hyphomicrobiales bacterium]MDE2115956.1 hypothetical protein [Hyphomicrobiales bacterium]